MGRYAKLVMISENNNNKYYILKENGNTIEAEYGRVDSTSTKVTYPIHKWDSIVNSKLKKGYKDVTSLVLEAVESGTTAKTNTLISKDKEVEKLILQLQSWAKVAIEQNYKVSASKVTQKMVDVAQELIDKLSNAYNAGANKDDLNKLLLEIYTTIPRKMGNVRDYLIQTTKKDDIEKLIDDEQKLLDTMAGQVTAITAVKEDEKNQEVTDLVTSLGLKINHIKDKKIVDGIKKLMGSSANLCKNVYEVMNVKTKKKYDEKAKTFKNEMLLFHGSRSQNWYNILQTGLLIRPSGVIHNGSMFSNGCYFANKAEKSIGYTSLAGSYWAGGNSNKSMLAIFQVNLGNEKHIYKHTNDCYHITEKNLAPYNSVYAHGGADLRNDEFIVYNTAQCTIKYLIEIAR
jgi:poly [ADP-ribose] polymerase